MSETDYDETIGQQSESFMTRDEALRHAAECPCKQCNPALTPAEPVAWIVHYGADRDIFLDRAHAALVFEDRAREGHITRMKALIEVDDVLPQQSVSTPLAPKLDIFEETVWIAEYNGQFWTAEHSRSLTTSVWKSARFPTEIAAKAYMPQGFKAVSHLFMYPMYPPVFTPPAAQDGHE